MSNIRSNNSIVSVICSHGSRIKCFLKQYNIRYDYIDQVVRIELVNGNYKIFIDNDKKYDINQTNKNTINYNYIFYIFSCQRDKYSEEINNSPRYNEIGQDTLNKIKQSLPENPDYLFSSDLKRSAIDLYMIYEDYILNQSRQIIILPCSHPTYPGSDKCNGKASLRRNIPYPASYAKYDNLRNWKYYEDFYGKGKRRIGEVSTLSSFATAPFSTRKHCSHTTFIMEAIKIINNR